MSASRLAAVAAALALAACAGGKAAPPPAAAAARAEPAPAPEPAVPAAPAAAPLPATGLELAVEPAGAEIFVDGDSRGVVSDLSAGVLGLAPGIYQVSLKAPGYVTWRAEVAVRTGREKIDVRLAKKDAAAR
jgi:glucose/arabinose dehydrogenase